MKRIEQHYKCVDGIAAFWRVFRGVYSSVYYPPRGVEKKKLIYKKREKKKLEIYALWRELAYLEIKTLFLWFQNIKKSGGKKMSQEFFRFCYRFFLFPVFFNLFRGKRKSGNLRTLTRISFLVRKTGKGKVEEK